jgi:tetratricopeptide (TPR) repeat protein
MSIHRHAPRLIFYGAILGAIAYGQPAARCLYNPFQETDLRGTCLRAGDMLLLPKPYRATALVSAARAYAAAGDAPSAMATDARALLIDPSPQTKSNVVNALNGMGNAEIAKGAYWPAILYFTKALNLEPGQRNALNQRGFAFQRTEQAAAALADYGEMVKLFPADKAGYGNRAGIYLDLGRDADAVEDLSAFIKIDAKDPWIWTARAGARLRLKFPTGALADAEQALLLERGNRQAHETRVRALYDLTRYNDVLSALDQWERDGGQKLSAIEQWRAFALTKSRR